MSDAADGFLSRWARRKAEVRGGRAAVAPAGVQPRTAPVDASRDATGAAVAGTPERGDATAGPAAAAAAARDFGGDAVEVIHAAEPHTTGRAAVDAPPAPTLDDVARLTPDSDYSRFVASGVDDGVKRAAMKKLFSDPHFNVMDGLDTYIDDYGVPDPIPLEMLRRMNQSALLGLFADETEPDAAPNDPTLAAEAADEPANPPDDHADLRLQQDDAAGRPGAAEGAGA